MMQRVVATSSSGSATSHQASTSGRGGNRTSHADRIGEPGAVIRRTVDGMEMVNLRWGLEPVGPGGRPFALVRAESDAFANRRCLIPASEILTGRDAGRLRISRLDKDWFYLAGVWRPATRRWPEAYAVLTIPAHADVAEHVDRHMAVIPRADRVAWLDGSIAASDLSRSLLPSTLRIERVAAGDARQPELSLGVE